MKLVDPHQNIVKLLGCCIDAVSRFVHRTMNDQLSMIKLVDPHLLRMIIWNWLMLKWKSTTVLFSAFSTRYKISLAHCSFRLHETNSGEYSALSLIPVSPEIIQDPYMMILELMPQGNLQDHLRKASASTTIPVSSNDLIKWAYQGKICNTIKDATRHDDHYAVLIFFYSIFRCDLASL